VCLVQYYDELIQTEGLKVAQTLSTKHYRLIDDVYHLKSFNAMKISMHYIVTTSIISHDLHKQLCIRHLNDTKIYQESYYNP
jgi:hypothetical protein